jgi:hypothetical protein
MSQLIEILSQRPEIICILISWPLLLWVLKVISQKIYFKYAEKK